MTRRNWKKTLILSALGILIGGGQGILLRYLYGMPSIQSFLVLATLFAFCDFLFAWNIERTTRSEGPGVWNSVVGRQGEVISMVGGLEAKSGTVRVNGEIWKARCRTTRAMLPGEKVRVTAREGLILRVEPIVSTQLDEEQTPA